MTTVKTVEVINFHIKNEQSRFVFVRYKFWYDQ